MDPYFISFGNNIEVKFPFPSFVFFSYPTYSTALYFLGSAHSSTFPRLARFYLMQFTNIFPKLEFGRKLEGLHSIFIYKI